MKIKRWLPVLLAALSLGLLGPSLMSCSGEVSFTTARLSEITMAKSIDQETYQPIEKTDTFGVNTPEIFLSAKFSNAPSDTEVMAEWVYVEGEAEELKNYLIDSVSINVSGTDYLYFAMPMPGQGWPRGQYEVTLYIDGKEVETVSFTVE
ncbi:MAG: hypothetical protein JW790_02100 [Dehalococcoidales bacterium]|nr:hypothetical protein [Dehalococcoidales bacterium]